MLLHPQTANIWVCKRNYFMPRETKTILRLASLWWSRTKLKYLRMVCQRNLDLPSEENILEFKICFRNTKALLLQSSLWQH